MSTIQYEYFDFLPIDLNQLALYNLLGNNVPGQGKYLVLQHGVIYELLLLFLHVLLDEL